MDSQIDSTSRLISIAERLLAAQLQRALDTNGIDLTIEQWRLLFYLWIQDGINQQELASAANKEKSTITRQIVALEKKGFIQRAHQSSDRRNKKILLTPKGLDAKEATLEITAAITAQSEKDINSDELATFRKVAKQLIRNTQSLNI